MRYILLFILTAFTFETFAQSDVAGVIKAYTAIATSENQVGSDNKKTQVQMARIMSEATTFIACLEAKDWDKAHKSVKKLYKLDKINRASHYITIGNVLEMKNEIKKATKIYQRAVARYNNSELAYYNMGRIYYNKGLEILVNAFELPTEQYHAGRDQSKEYFRQALPFFETGYQINRNIDFLPCLRTIYYTLEMNDKFLEVEQLIEGGNN